MTNKRNIITLLIMLSLSLGLYANGNGEKEQKLSKLIIKEGNTVIDEFSIIRDASLGQELFYIVSSIVGRKYYVDLVSTSDINGGNPVTFEISKDDDIGIEIEGVNSYVSSLSSSDLDLRRLNPVHNYYKPEITQIGVRLISYDSPANSYQFILNVHPTVTINSAETVSDSVLKESLRDNAIYRRFFRKQVLGDSSFTATESNPFPIANLENHYDYLMENNSTADETIVDRVQFETFIRPFDVIYNHNVSDNEEMGDSIIYKFLKVYFNNNKPLFHSYINEYMDDNFNYHQYDKITAIEGKELVNHALKYLTWGLEYTPEENYRAITGGDNIYPSQLLNYEGTEDEDEFNDLTKWIRTNTSVDENRSKNYLGFVPANITDNINESDVTYDQDKIDELQALAGDYFTPTKKATSGLELTTPFKVGNTIITGSSLPYVKGGIDTPRTFNYKMTEQFDIINRYLANTDKATSWYGIKNGGTWSRNDYYFSITSAGLNKSNSSFYFNSNEDFVNSESDEPFYPGRVDNDKYKGLNLTGVDSLGLLSGALSMTSFYKEILNISNNAPATNMDTLNRMTTLPAFSSNPQENQDLYRLTRNDIERSTVIIPDLSQMQPGDLLVKGSGDETDVAIVIDTGYTAGDETFYLGNVLVLTVNDIDKRVAVCYWGQNGTYSSFTTEPKNYVLRRLLKFTGTISDNDEYSFSKFTELEKTADYWDPFVFQPEPIYVHMDTSSSRNNSRWISNTGEIYEISSIKFSSSDSDVKPILELEDYNNAEVIIKAPSDINYDVTEAGHDNTITGNNILVNKGDGFAFYALNTFTDSTTNEEYYDAIRLATFNINTSSTNEFDRYTVEYNDDIFTSDGRCKDGFTLKYKKYEGLEFNIGIDNKFTNFGIRPLETNIRPGDDILLNFEIYDNGNSIPVNSPEREFLAVYDEKMLWRANLYINEGGTDWNNENPWNAPSTTADADAYGAVEDNGIIKRFMENSGTFSELGMFKYHNSPDWIISGSERVWYGANEWNKKYITGDTFDINNFKLSNMIDSNGTQVIEVFEYTPFRTVGGTTASPTKSNFVKNRVAYSYPMNKDFNFILSSSLDSPFDFNYKIKDQQRLIRAKFSEQVASPYTSITLDELKTWDTTKAPRNKWQNYMHGSFNNQKPYLPGLGLFYKAVSSDWTSFTEVGANPDDDDQTAGVDCIGFAQRSASYLDNNYLWKNLKTGIANENQVDNSNRSYPYIDGSTESPHSWKITSYDDEDDNDLIIDLDKVIPGDVFFYTTNPDGIYVEDRGGEHIAIVKNISYVDNSEIPNLKSIQLIESTFSGNNAYIFTSRNIKDNYSNKNWFIVRLK